MTNLAEGLNKVKPSLALHWHWMDSGGAGHNSSVCLNYTHLAKTQCTTHNSLPLLVFFLRFCATGLLAQNHSNPQR
jgi:hypothetical protein